MLQQQQQAAVAAATAATAAAAAALPPPAAAAAAPPQHPSPAGASRLASQQQGGRRRLRAATRTPPMMTMMMMAMVPCCWLPHLHPSESPCPSQRTATPPWAMPTRVRRAAAGRRHHHGQMAVRAGPLRAGPPTLPKRVMVRRKNTRQLPKIQQAQDRSTKCRELIPPALGGGRGADKSRRRVLERPVL